MKNLIKITIAVSLFFIYNPVFSQGLILNETTDEWLTTLSEPEPTRSIPPIRFSLEEYAPSVLDQKTTQMCLSFALSNIATIQYAKEVLKTTDINLIDKKRFSPTFIYYLFKDSPSCETSGLMPRSPIEYIGKFGIPFSSDVEENIFFPYTDSMICQHYPYKLDDLIDDIHKGSSYTMIGGNIFTGNTPNDKILCGKFSMFTSNFVVNHYKLQSQISQGIPCLLAKDKHAEVIIGYNDTLFDGEGAYRILGSYGEYFPGYEDKGKKWIRKNDLNIFRGFIATIDFNMGEKADKKEIRSYIDKNSKNLSSLHYMNDNDYEVQHTKVGKLVNKCKMKYENKSKLIALHQFCQCYINNKISKGISLSYIQYLFPDYSSVYKDPFYLDNLKNGCVEGDCLNGIGTWVFGFGNLTGDFYEGEWKNSKMHGDGTYIFADGSKYVGSWKDNKYHGNGTYTSFDGITEEQFWINGGQCIDGNCKNGYGFIKYSSGDILTFEGEFKDQKMHGKGTETKISGDQLKGKWKKGKKHGKFTYLFKNGLTVKQKYRNGERVK